MSAPKTDAEESVTDPHLIPDVPELSLFALTQLLHPLHEYRPLVSSHLTAHALRNLHPLSLTPSLCMLIPIISASALDPAIKRM